MDYLSNIAGYASEAGSSSYVRISEIATLIGLWMMMSKAGEPGWVGIIPFYNSYKLCEKVMNRPWYWTRLFVAVIPVVGWIMALHFAYQISAATAKAYGKPDSWAWGYLLLRPVFYCITGFDDSVYYGPYGEGDRRTPQARSARTVDFDVIRNEGQSQNNERVTRTTVEELKPNQYRQNGEIREFSSGRNGGSSDDVFFDVEEGNE